jgi:histidinol-phosphatase (PHP family)
MEEILFPQDYHVHTLHSCDSQASMAAMCMAAIKKGIPEIGFTDHFDLVPDDPCYAFFRADAWWHDLEICRREFAGSLRVKAGIEIGEPHRFPKAVAELIGNHDWDFVLGSLHWVGDTLVFHPDYYRRPKLRAFADYFQELIQLAQQSPISILAHMDIVKRYGFEHFGSYDPETHEEDLRKLFRICAQRDIALEVNTSTLRRSIQETSPTQVILKWFREEGGRWVTLGSDAHKPEEVGYGFEKALTSIADAGFETLASFERLKPSPVPIPSLRGRS